MKLIIERKITSVYTYVIEAANEEAALEIAYDEDTSLADTTSSEDTATVEGLYNDGDPIEVDAIFVNTTDEGEDQ